MALAAALLIGAAPWASAVAAGVPTVSAGALGPGQGGVWYEIFVRSFQDSDGDGIGDLRGVLERLPYLSDLGVTGLWLMPIHPSPSYHGYDVTDYRAVNPDYGTLDDLRHLLDAAHARGMRVVLDLVPNHTSDAHPWFRAALAGDPRYRDYYVWADAPLDWRGTRGGPAWHPAGDAVYLGLFSASMPDLNYRNPAVMREMEAIARYWLDVGVDGFRVDAIQHIVESQEGVIANTSETFAWVRAFEDAIHGMRPGAFLVGETWTEAPSIARYLRDGRLDLAFDYPRWRAVLAALQARSAADLGALLEQERRLYPPGAGLATFLANHDQVRPATTLSFVRRDEPRMRLAAGLLLTLPGTPYLYYGEEIGLPNGDEADDRAKRTPMRWRDGPGGGFTDGVPWALFSSEEPGISVEAQRADPESLWWHYRRLIALRRLHPALDHGSTEVLEAGSRGVLALRRSADDDRLVVLANLGARPVDIDGAAVGIAGGRELLSGATVGRRATLPGLALWVVRLP